MQRIALIDYGAGNLTSVRKGFGTVGAGLFTPSHPSELVEARAIVVPGVGNFRATAALDGQWRAAIAEAMARGTPLLGICLGLQWLFESSDEAPDVPGLGTLAGRCALLRTDTDSRLKVPHVGWNSLTTRRQSRLMEGVPDGAQVYFTHSFAAPVTDACVASTTHGVEFAAVVESKNVFGVQFHPEKSSEAGLRILRNFVGVTSA